MSGLGDFVHKRIVERENRIRLIDGRLKEINAEKDRLAQEKATINIELSVYKDVNQYNILRGDENESEVISEAYDHDGRIIGIATTRTRMSEVWKKILIDIGDKYPIKLNTDDIRSIAQRHNPEINDDTLRSQLSVYTSRGFLERPSVGQYLITKAGARVSGYKWREDQTELAYFPPVAEDDLVP